MALECLFPGPSSDIPEPHRLISEPDARALPSGEKATALTIWPWPSSVCFQARVVASQSRTVLSYEPDARTLPPGEKATDLTQWLWPSSVCSQTPVMASQSCSVRSNEADVRAFPSGEKATALTPRLWPSRVCRQGSQLSLIPLTFFMNYNLSFQCWIFTSLLIGLDASVAP